VKGEDSSGGRKGKRGGEKVQAKFERGDGKRSTQRRTQNSRRWRRLNQTEDLPKLAVQFHCWVVAKGGRLWCGRQRVEGKGAVVAQGVKKGPTTGLPILTRGGVTKLREEVSMLPTQKVERRKTTLSRLLFESQGRRKTTLARSKLVHGQGGGGSLRVGDGRGGKY